MASVGKFSTSMSPQSALSSSISSQTKRISGRWLAMRSNAMRNSVQVSHQAAQRQTTIMAGGRGQRRVDSARAANYAAQDGLKGELPRARGRAAIDVSPVLQRPVRMRLFVALFTDLFAGLQRSTDAIG